MPTIGTEWMSNPTPKHRDHVHVLYWIGVQKGSTDIANWLPMMEIGMVEPNMATRTTGNLAQSSPQWLHTTNMKTTYHSLKSPRRLVNHYVVGQQPSNIKVKKCATPVSKVPRKFRRTISNSNNFVSFIFKIRHSWKNMLTRYRCDRPRVAIFENPLQQRRYNG